MPRPSPLSDEAIVSALTALSSWRREGDRIVRTIRFRDFAEAARFVARVTPIADAMNHHPDLEVSYGRVTVSLTTHDAQGLTALDVDLARAIDALDSVPGSSSLKRGAYAVEVVTATLRSTLAAVRGGASRIELVSAFGAGGTTPSLGLLREAKRHVDVPVLVMVRPREGDFVYDRDELDTMRADLDAAAESGADGFVLGVLRDDGHIDGPRMAEFVKRAAGLPVVCHRAFDVAVSRDAALEAIVDAGCVRVMTSGGAKTAPEGKAAILETHAAARGRIAVMPGGGIRAETFHDVFSPELTDYHLAGRAPVVPARTSPLFELGWEETDEGHIRAVCEHVAKA